MMFKAKTACDKVVNLELNSRKKQSKNGMKIALLKCSWVADAGTLFSSYFKHSCGSYFKHLCGTARPSKPANFVMSVIET